MNDARITEWMSPNAESLSCWGLISNREWCNKEIARLDAKGIKAHVIERGRVIAVARTNED